MTYFHGGRSWLKIAVALALYIAQLTNPLWAGALQRSIGTGAAAHTIRAQREGPESDDHPYSEAELQGVGCLGVGGVSTLVAYMINTNEYLMIAAGGTLASTSPAVVALALFSTVAASGCAVGAIATPVLLRWYRDAQDYWEANPDA